MMPITVQIYLLSSSLDLRGLYAHLSAQNVKLMIDH